MFNRIENKRKTTHLAYTPPILGKSRAIKPFAANRPTGKDTLRDVKKELKQDLTRKAVKGIAKHIGNQIMKNAGNVGGSSFNADEELRLHLRTVNKVNKDITSSNLDAREKFDACIAMKDINYIDTKPVVSKIVTNSMSTQKLVNNSETRKTHKTVFETGERTSRAILTAAKTNGTHFGVLYDSKIENRSVLERAALTFGAGFNSKHVWIPRSEMHVSKEMIRRVLSRSLATTEFTRADAQSKIFASFMKVKNQFMIHNNSAFLPAVVKIYMIKFNEAAPNGVSMQTFIRDCVPNITQLNAVNTALTAGTTIAPTLQPSSLVPWYYCHSTASIASSFNEPAGFKPGQYVSANFSLKGRGFMDSTSFKQKINIIETFEKTLEPGDFWNYSHVHHFGNGLEEAIFLRSLNNSFINRDTTDDPFTYGIMIETKGKLVEGISVTGTESSLTETSYQGSSPTYLSVENRSSIYYVKEDERAVDQIFDTTVVATVSGSVGPNSEAVHRRRYVSDPRTISWQDQSNRRTREVFALPSDISTFPSPDKFYVPVVTQSNVERDRKPHAAD